MSEQFDSMSPEARKAKRQEIRDNRRERARGGNEDAYLPQKGQAVQYRIDDAGGSQLLLWAGVFDFFSLVPGLNAIIVFIAQPIFFIWFNFFFNVPTFGQRTWLWYLIAWVVEIIPFLSIFPTYTLMVFRMIAISRSEDLLQSKGLDVEGQKTKAIARRVLRNKKVQAFAQRQQQTPIKNKDGSVNTEKEGPRQERLKGARAGLDASLQNKGRDANSGVSNNKEPYQDYLTGEDYNPKEYGIAGTLARPRKP